MTVSTWAEAIWFGEPSANLLDIMIKAAKDKCKGMPRSRLWKGCTNPADAMVLTFG